MLVPVQGLSSVCKSVGPSHPLSISVLGSHSLLRGHLSTVVWNNKLMKGEMDSSTQAASLHLFFALSGINYEACSVYGALMCFVKYSGTVKSQ